MADYTEAVTKCMSPMGELKNQGMGRNPPILDNHGAGVEVRGGWMLPYMKGQKTNENNFSHPCSIVVFQNRIS